jgi:hypothetical protein
VNKNDFVGLGPVDGVPLNDFPTIKRRPTFRLLDGHYVFPGHRVELSQGRCPVGVLADELGRAQLDWPKSHLCLVSPEDSAAATLRARSTFLLVMDEPLAGVFVRELKRAGYRVYRGPAQYILNAYSDSLLTKPKETTP